MTELTLRSPAKLNLFLHILGRRADGYHQLQTLFQLIDLADELSFNLSDNDGIRLINTDADPTLNAIPPESNLIYKAAALLKQNISQEVPGAEISIRKQIPRFLVWWPDEDFRRRFWRSLFY